MLEMYDFVNYIVPDCFWDNLIVCLATDQWFIQA